MADTNATLNLVQTALTSLPPCGLACIQKLPEWVQPLTIDALTGVCTNIQKDVDLFSTCVKTGCTNTTELNSAITVVGLVPTGCLSLGFNVTGVVVPKITLPTAAATTAAATTAPVTTKSGGSNLHAFAVLATAVAVSALLF
ncbi:UNVERIFIED_CONTAM: hypothetical protein HDU68_006661 [Siphonaria sp. JEL0065]|nr:hypothetical protein HDU68_006661 [Siphonaria sp. JEL0065]